MWACNYIKIKGLILKLSVRGGEGEMYGKSNMEIYITRCKRDSQ